MPRALIERHVAVMEQGDSSRGPFGTAFQGQAALDRPASKLASRRPLQLLSVALPASSLTPTPAGSLGGHHARHPDPPPPTTRPSTAQ